MTYKYEESIIFLNSDTLNGSMEVRRIDSGEYKIIKLPSIKINGDNILVDDKVVNKEDAYQEFVFKLPQLIFENDDIKSDFEDYIKSSIYEFIGLDIDNSLKIKKLKKNQ